MQTLLARPQIAAIQPSGHINAANADEFRQQLLAGITTQSVSNIVVDMNTVESMDSAGLVALVAALTQAQQLNKRLMICGVSSRIRIIFELTQLDRVFEMFENRAAAEAAIA
ncbi:MAG: STAS domain-containing protein [Oculatellaceae cyanobacterium bins.114]|nr:STAS domain-containing protein [Oculatellaceae cyanobacterium bins.114]